MRIILCTLLFAAAGIAAWPAYHDPTATALGSLPIPAALLHLLAATGMALTAAICIPPRSGARLPLAIISFLITLVLPLAGAPLSGLLLLLMRIPPRCRQRPEDHYYFANPLTASTRRETHMPHPELRPLIEAARLLPAAELPRLLRGLHGLTPPRQTIPLLRHYLTDAQAAIQFTAQGVLTGQIEDLELALKKIKDHWTAHPDTPRSAQSLQDAAEILLALLQWTPPGDATAQVYAAEAHALLTALPAAAQQQPHARRLLALASLASGHHPAATALAAALHQQAPHHPQHHLLALEAHVAHGHWASAVAHARTLQHPPANAEEIYHFWATPVTP